MKGAPWFFVSVALKGFSVAVSLLDATLTGCLVNVADKGLTDRPDPVGISAPEMRWSFDLNVKMAEGPAFAEAMAGHGGVYPPPFLHEPENKWVAKCTPVSV